MVVDFSFPIFILFAVNRDEDIVRESWWGHCPWIVMKTLSVNPFQSKVFYILHEIVYKIPLNNIIKNWTES